MIPTKINRFILYLGALGALAACLLSGCAPKIQKLEIIRIGKIRLDSITRDIVALRAEIAVRNPYSTSARLKNISFDLAITDHSIAYGKLTGSTELKGGATAILDVPLAVRCKEITEKDLNTLFAKEIPYRMDGNAVLERPFGPRTLPIQVRSHMPAPDGLQLSLSNKSVAEVLALDVSGTRQLATLIGQRRLSVRFFNPFSFPITIQDFQYDVRLGERILADGTSPDPILLDPGKNRLSVSVQPHLLGAATELLDLLIHRALPDIAMTSNFNVIRNERALRVRLIYSPQ